MHSVVFKLYTFLWVYHWVDERHGSGVEDSEICDDPHLLQEFVL